MNNIWPQVDKFEDQDSLNAATLNTPVDQLAARTDYLKRRIQDVIDGGYQSALILQDVDLIPEGDESFLLGDIVYRGASGFHKAQAKMSLCDDFSAAESAFTLGILVEVNGQQGDVLIYGKLAFENYPDLRLESMLQTGEEFRNGRYYVSPTEPGKLTSFSKGALIYVGSFHTDTNKDTYAIGYINPQFLDLGQSHIHRAYALTARPAGALDSNDLSKVIGHLPDGVSAETEDSESYPSLIFGGTWTSTEDITYNFALSGASWGFVSLQWSKNGSASHKTVNIPAPGVFVPLDNGLLVKVIFPGATKSTAYSVPEEKLQWTLSFPTAGKGWLNHTVDAVASILGEEPASATEGTTPVLKALFSGTWPKADNKVYCYFPGSVLLHEFHDLDALTELTIDGDKYQFVSKGETAKSNAIPVTKASTVEESLVHLAQTVSPQVAEAKILVKGNTLIGCSCSLTLDDGTSISSQHKGAEFNIIGGTIPLMVVYSSNYLILGDIFTNEPTYVPLEAGKLTVTVFAEGATSQNNYTCKVETRLVAEAYDYATDAKYDYVMGLHQEVDYYYPPVPAQAAGLFVNGIEVGNKDLLPGNATYKLGKKTLHWLEDDEYHRPWPEGIQDGNIEQSKDKAMAFHFVVGFQCATGPVTSLTPAPGAPIKIYTYGTNESAHTGDLMIDAALDFHVNDANIKGYNVAKQGRGGALLAGPVVEKVQAGNGILITQKAGCPSGQGTVTISLDDGTMRGHFNEIALENAKQEKLGLFPYISLLGWGGASNIPSAFTMMMRVPSNLDPAKDYQMQLRVVMFGATGYKSQRKQFAGIQMEYNILPDLTGTDTHRSLKTGLLTCTPPRQISVPLGHEVNNQWEYIAYDPFVATTEASSKEFPMVADIRVPLYPEGTRNLPIPYDSEMSQKLKPGYLVALRFSRVAPSGTGSGTRYDAYTGPLGFLSMEWTLEEL